MFNTLRFVGAQGDIAYEGRMAALPRESGAPPTWNVQAAGLMANAKDRRFRMIFVDRDMTQWGDAPLERRAAMANSGIPDRQDPGAARPGAGIAWELPNEALPAGEHHDLVYDAGPGVGIGSVHYRGTETGASGRRSPPRPCTRPRRRRLSGARGTLTLDNTLRSVSFEHPGAAVRRAAERSRTARSLPPPGHQRQFDLFNVIGDHGITVPPAVDGLLGVTASRA